MKFHENKLEGPSINPSELKKVCSTCMSALSNYYYWVFNDKFWHKK
jgi:hypothetical protein